MKVLKYNLRRGKKSAINLLLYNNPIAITARRGSEERRKNEKCIIQSGNKCKNITKLFIIIL